MGYGNLPAGVTDKAVDAQWGGDHRADCPAHTDDDGDCWCQELWEDEQVAYDLDRDDW